MSDQYTELVLEELGLLPLWLPPERMPTPASRPRTAPPAAGAQEASPAIDKPSDTANPPQALRSRPPLPATQPAAPTPAPPAAASPAGSVNRDERALRIATLDWEGLQAEAQACTACGLCKTRNKVVFGVGQPSTDWLVVGEAPGAEEDRQGEPFVGQAGKLLDNMLAAVGRSRQENVYILNTLKCRPPQNRNPQPDEMALCAAFLQRQVALIQPKVIFAVGRFAVQALLGRDASIASLRGQLHEYQGIPVVVSYHPAYLLRNLPDKIKAWQDLLLARKTLAEHKAPGAQS